MLVKLLSQVGTATSATKPSNLIDQNLLSLIEQKNAFLAELSGKLNKTEKSAVDISSTRNSIPLHRPPAVAALNDSFSETSDNANGMRSEIYHLKGLIEKLSREMDARFRGLARRNQGQREELPRQMTRDGQPLCFARGRRGHFQESCPELRNNAVRGSLPQQNRSQGGKYQPNYNYNQPWDNYLHNPQQDRRDQPLAVLEEEYYDEHFVAELEQNLKRRTNFPSAVKVTAKKPSRQTTNCGVKIISKDSVVFCKKSPNSLKIYILKNWQPLIHHCLLATKTTLGPSAPSLALQLILNQAFSSML